MLLIATAAFVCSFAFVSVFGHFTASDDEGYSIATMRLVSEGVPLYTGQFV
jgi:hypothetical protein